MPHSTDITPPPQLLRDKNDQDRHKQYVKNSSVEHLIHNFCNKSFFVNFCEAQSRWSRFYKSVMGPSSDTHPEAQKTLMRKAITDL